MLLNKLTFDLKLCTSEMHLTNACAKYAINALIYQSWGWGHSGAFKKLEFNLQLVPAVQKMCRGFNFRLNIICSLISSGFCGGFFLCVDSIPDKKKQRGILKNIFIIFWANVHNAHVEIQALPNIFFFILKKC